jgi:hypothetical protein
MWNIFPEEPDRAEPPVTTIDMELVNSVSIKEQVAVFRGIPEGARNCIFTWRAGEIGERVFREDGLGTTKLRFLKGFPAQGERISANSIAPFWSEGDQFSVADFSNWSELAGTTHNGSGPGTCAPTMWIRTHLDKAQNPTLTEGFVFMEQDEKNGWILQYDC